jgi:membrane-bound serine protease (ClpP class)
MYAGGADGIRKAVGILLLLMLMVLWAREAVAQETGVAVDSATSGVAFVLDVQGPIGPATRDFVSRSLKTAAERDASLVIIRMDTPGGLDASTRDIIKDILNSPVPVATWVGPAGARAASAGTYILYASHVAAMSPASIIGGAPGKAPESSDGKAAKKKHADEADEADEAADGEAGEAASAASAGDTMMKKTVNDSVAYIRGLAGKRGRNADWAELAVREADSITAEKALELGVIDLIAANIGDLMEQADGRVVEVNDREVTLETSGLVTEQLEPDWRSEMLAVITSPTIAYLLLLIGIYGLILEGYHPGAILPGVVGAICLLTALYAFQMLPVNYAGLGLILLGIILMIAEVMSPSFGVLGFGGIIAMVFGSIILIDSDVPGYTVSRSLIGAIAVAGSLGMMAIIWIALRARQRPVVSGREELIGAVGFALEDFAGDGHVYVHSERWNAVAEAPVRENQAVVVTGLDGLTLMVRPVNVESQEQENV